jgi:hypothetical protein
MRALVGGTRLRVHGIEVAGATGAMCRGNQIWEPRHLHLRILLNLKAYRGFESLSLRQLTCSTDTSSLLRFTVVLETITVGDDDLTTWCSTWCGPIAKLPTDRFAAALLMALALREQFSQDRLSSFAKGLRVNVAALSKRLKVEKPDETAS